MKKNKNRYAAGGRKLASIKGYHKLLSLRAHGKITSIEFAKKAAKLLKQK